MAIEQSLQREVLTRLYHAHPAGLGKEVLDNFEGDRAVADCLVQLQSQGLIQGGTVTGGANGQRFEFPVKLTSAGVEQAKALLSD
jgi:hypothetical protein